MQYKPSLILDYTKSVSSSLDQSSLTQKNQVRDHTEAKRISHEDKDYNGGT